MNNSFKRYFTFWFTTIANGGDLRLVYLNNKDFYIKTSEAAKKHGPIIEDSSLGAKIEKIFASNFVTQ